ncbi:MAG: 23S rRNA (uracil(1939)-C(5))-methyltransferase RlmD [Oscillochloridaceae bacterium]|nr:23S rRNA (uracil(1939)-C(5))-methyltransferase RlmD [Chloroflexaceae bacterium]MDW8391714.1 23S rRNA (uracil(1939)-C(5))-methyltransferase RlmD [Oscillochloridaceae bacterium]
MRAKEFRRLVTDLARSGEAVLPRCRHAVECGGCAFQDRAYSAQIAAKRTALGRVFTEVGAPTMTAAGDLELVPSPDPFGYRTRMDYVTTRGRFGLRARGRFSQVVDLEECHLIPPVAFAAARAVWAKARALDLPDYDVRRHEGFLRYIVVRRSPDNELLLATVTAAGEPEEAMERLAAAALEQPGVVGFHWLRNDSLTDLSFGVAVRHWGAATLSMRVGRLRLAIGPNTFFQNNVHLLERLLDDVSAAVEPGSRAVADLYGGVGLIALTLAPRAASVVCVEAIEESATLARENAASNGVANVQIIAADVAAYLRAQGPGAFDVMVLDPPRTGLGPDVCREVLRIGPRRIVYVSCNPLSQIEDLRMLAPVYAARFLRGYDMFPHTPHVETLAVLDRA